MFSPLIRLILILAWFHGQPLWATPYIPQDDNEVLERLPSAMNGTARELRGLGLQLEQDPRNLALTTDLAWRYIELGRSESDPRYFGYAQGVLQPWWLEPSPPTEVLILRATLRQNRHEFASALEDLRRLLAHNPRDVQAWLTQATIQQVQADYPAARQSCLRLARLADDLVTTTCLSNIASLTGQADQAYRQLRQAVESSTDASSEVRLWSLTSLAEIALRSGKIREAETSYREALALGQQDAYLLGAYADFLLDQGRPAEVETLLGGETRADGLLLRRALALHRLNPERAQGLIDTLQARFAASNARGESVHQGEEARFTLHLLRQPRAALRLAQRNWAAQREPRDARILLEATLAADDAAAAQPIIAMIEDAGLEDPQLSALIARLETTP
jgi:tetratricopeptide (TPR) repeat protein